MSTNPNLSFAQKVQKKVQNGMQTTLNEVQEIQSKVQQLSKKHFPDNPEMAQAYAQELIKTLNKMNPTSIMQETKTGDTIGSFHFKR